MKTFDLLVDMLSLVQRRAKDEKVQLVLYNDLSGYIGWAFHVGGSVQEHRLFSWGRGYSELLPNFVGWLMKYDKST